ncbi:hypothetical protein [Lacrimispora sp.]|nr:hypothetical protein [Lacrimispora sp.]
MARRQPLPDGIATAGQRLLPIDFPLSLSAKKPGEFKRILLT